MNPHVSPTTLSDVPWPTGTPRVPVPDTSMLPGSEHAPQAAVALLNTAVREHPLATVAAALLFGALVARLTR